MSLRIRFGILMEVIMDNKTLKEIKLLCLKHQKKNFDCESCTMYRFCMDNFSNYPSGWKIEEKSK